MQDPENRTVDSTPEDADYETHGRRTDLAAAEELDIALRTITNFTGSISGADTKASLLIPALGVGLGGMYSQLSAVRASLSAMTPLHVLAVLLLAALLCSALAALVYLAATLIPRTSSPTGGPNLFAFPSFPPNRTRAPLTAETLCAQAWEQAEVLARIATVKHRRLQSALRWSCTALLAVLGWTAVLPFLG